MTRMARCEIFDPAEVPTVPEINSIAGCPVKRAETRERLSSFSWWMRLLCQRVAARANHEDEQSGRFFQDRYHATLLADESSLLACAAYVDLNPVRAAMAETLEQSDHTSVQRRVEGLEDYLDLLDWRARHTAPGKCGRTPAETPPILVRHGLDTATWCELLSDFGRLFCSAAGRPECVESMRCHRTHRRNHLRRRARELLSTGD